jgi:anaerobic ribonucleoside-triphosphate reductase activating protein
MRTSHVFLPVAQIVAATEAEGPFRRYALWLQGCPLRCPGCCNEHMLPFTGGIPRSVAALLDDIVATPDIEGITLLGGEPFAHAHGAALLAVAVRERQLGVMVFTGFTLAQIQKKADPDELALLTATDLLVDGPYLRDRPDTRRRWVGSTNQEVHFLSERYSPGDPCWRQPNTVELRLTRRGLAVNGFPQTVRTGGRS